MSGSRASQCKSIVRPMSKRDIVPLHRHDISADHMAARIRRRDFIGALGGAAVAWPLAVRAQQTAMPVIGLLGSATASDWARNVNAFRQGLRDAGYVEGSNVAIEARWANSQYERLPAMAAELIQRQVTVMAAF